MTSIEDLERRRQLLLDKAAERKKPAPPLPVSPTKKPAIRLDEDGAHVRGYTRKPDQRTFARDELVLGPENINQRGRR